MLESGKELGVPLYLTGLTRQLFQTAIAAGHGDEDICSTIKVLEEFDRDWKWFPKNKYKKLLLPETESTIIGIKPGRQLPPKRD